MNIVCLDSPPGLVILFKCCTELNGAVVLNICTAAVFFLCTKIGQLVCISLLPTKWPSETIQCIKWNAK